MVYVHDADGPSRVPGEVADLLASVARPGRYVGGEFHVRRKPGGAPYIVLSYPDTYEIGVSNPGLQILYAQLNDTTPARVERAYCPWPDLAAAMRARGVLLWSLESFTPVRLADAWGITLQHELTYTNVLEMLDLAGVPVHAEARGDGDPIVIGGGPGTANPVPLAAFFDAFFVGEAEGRLSDMVEALGAPSRAQRLERLAAVPGVWAPGRVQPARADGSAARRKVPQVVRQVFTEFAATSPVTEPLVPLVEAVHDRAVVEVMRGCSAGCRFCQAGVWYRPVRERPVELVVEAAGKVLRATGCDEVSLISLSSCDYSGIEDAVREIRARHPGVRVSLPSLRIDSAAVTLARLGSEQRGSLTLAPEAGTQTLRDAVNKRVDGTQFDEAVRAAHAAGFTGVKLYFMIGLPGETDDDVAAIAEMARTAASHGKELVGGRARLSVAVSSFVPKAHTPFQWETFTAEAVIRRRQELLRGRMPRGIKLSFHDVGASLVEASLATGDGECAALIEGAWRRGARFDGWREHFDRDVWQAAATATGIELGAREAYPGALPWGVVDPLVSGRFLDEERVRAPRGTPTEDCRGGICESCGVCGGEIEMELVG